MFNFVRVVVEPGVRTPTVAWEAPVKQSIALYLLLSENRSIAESVAAAGISAVNCRCLVLQQQIAAAATAAAAVAVTAAGCSGLPVGTKIIGWNRWCGKIVRVVSMCGPWASR